MIPGATSTVTFAITTQLTSTIPPIGTAQLTSTPARPSSTSTPTIAFTGTFTPSVNPSGFSAGTLAGEEIRDGIEKGNEIVRAIEIYNLDQGHYPLSLDDLVPNYISNSPVTSTGQPYFYRLFGSTDKLAFEIYWLAFRVAEQEHTICTYYRRLEYWDCNFASP